MTIFKLEMKGPDNTLRVRQIKMLGGIKGASLAVGKQQTPLVMQQKACEAETLKVFRLLTSEVSHHHHHHHHHCHGLPPHHHHHR